MLCFDVDGETTALSEDPALARAARSCRNANTARASVCRVCSGCSKHLAVPATFFIPAYIAEQHPRMVEAIVEAGHEIGLHGYLHEKLAHLSEAEEEDNSRPKHRNSDARHRHTTGGIPCALVRDQSLDAGLLAQPWPSLLRQ